MLDTWQGSAVKRCWAMGQRFTSLRTLPSLSSHCRAFAQSKQTQVAGLGATFTGAKYTIGFTILHLRHVI